MKEYHIAFEENQKAICSSLDLTKNSDGSYSSPLTQSEFLKFSENRRITSLIESVELSDEDKSDFIRLIALHLVTCYFEDQKLVIPSGQGRSVPLAVYSALDGFKYAKALKR